VGDDGIRLTPRRRGAEKGEPCVNRHVLGQDGYDIRTAQELPGHADVSTTTIYTHVLQRGRALGAESCGRVIGVVPCSLMLTVSPRRLG
jgi:hypothetical protein